MAEKTDLRAGDVFDTGARDQAMLVLKREADRVRVAELGGEQRNDLVIDPREAVRVWKFRSEIAHASEAAVQEGLVFLRAQVGNLSYAEDHGFDIDMHRFMYPRRLDMRTTNKPGGLFKVTQFSFDSSQRYAVAMSALDLNVLPCVIAYPEANPKVLTKESADWLRSVCKRMKLSLTSSVHASTPLDGLSSFRATFEETFESLKAAHGAALDVQSKLPTGIGA